MLSRGVVAPDSISSGSSARITSSPNCGMPRATVASRMPSEVVANRCSKAPPRNSAIEPCSSTCNRPRTTPNSETVVASITTDAIDHSLASRISSGTTGITSRCSTVPCSRSRIRAAPARITDSMVM